METAVSVQAPIYMIHCWRPLQNCYYGVGINLCNINFSTFDEVRLLRILIVGKKTIKKNFYPALCCFQRALKLRFHDVRNPRNFLRRQATGEPLVKPFHHYLQQSYKRLRGASS